MGVLVVAALAVAGAGAARVILAPEGATRAANPRSPGKAPDAEFPGSGLVSGTAGSTPALPGDMPGSAAQDDWQAFARSGGLTLILPDRDPVAVAYHQAYYGDGIPMHPLGHLTRNANKWQFKEPADAEGPDYLVQASRGRATGPTTAVDILMDRDETVYAPVSGTVVKAKRYRLYGRYPDWRVEIRPSDLPELRVVVIHLADVEVRRGDDVFATISPIGIPRELPFHSVVNDYVRGGDPHVHIEVKEVDKKKASR